MRATLPIIDPVPYRPNGKLGLRQARRVVQVATLLAWFGLFLASRQPIAALGARVDLFLASDPLVAALTMGAAQVFVPTLALGIFWILFTLVFGRAFCGWICPLGTLIDAAAYVFKPKEDRLSPTTHARLQHVKYIALAVMAAGAVFSAQWVYLLDPLVILFRGMAVGVWPALTGVLPASWFPGSTGMKYHAVTFLPLALFFGTLLVTAITPRFYCRYLCPLGAFFGLLSRVALLRRRVEGCDACHAIGSETKQCVTGCRMGAVPSNPHLTQNHECIRCFSGRSFCHTEAIEFAWRLPKVERPDAALALDRRVFLTATASGLLAAPLAALATPHPDGASKVIRPPRVLDEDTFTDECIRCAMCVQACPTQTLQLTHFEAGVAGFWTPAVTPSVGGCISDCNACSDACPTDAIPVFRKDEASKWPVKMGTVVLEKGRCISWTHDEVCGECLDVCPTKAFVIEPAHDGVPRRPDAVDYFRCVGCGLCETKCRDIVFGTPALVTFAHGRGVPTKLREEPTAEFVPPKVRG